MRIAVIDPFSGAAGDMFLGALIDAGADLQELRAGLATLPVGGFELTVERVRRAGLAALKAHVRLAALSGGEEGSHAHGPHGGGPAGHGRRPAELLDAIARSGLPEGVKALASRAFLHLAEAEARVHGTTVDEVHFHEVGATDALVDVCGTALALHLLGVGRVHARAVATGYGTLRAAHGTLPVPGPATLELLTGLPIAPTEVEAELVTPTGAALLRSLEPDFGPPPPLRVERAGYGAGSDDRPGRPNVLRILLGTTLGGVGGADVVCEVVFEVDDMTPEALGHLRSVLPREGVLDVSVVPCQMKKDRPGHRVSLLCAEGALGDVERVIFRHTTTFGFRLARLERRTLPRETVTVETPLGPCRVKLGRLDGEVVRRHPEADDVARLSREHGLSWDEVVATVLAAAPEE